MKRPLLKILPGVAVVLISASCSKDDDNNIAEDNTALVAEQKIEHKVFYLKVTNASSLSKMAVDLTAGKNKALTFEVGDKLTIKFVIKVNTMVDSGVTSYDPETNETITIIEPTYEDVDVTVTATATYTEDGSFAVITSEMQYNPNWVWYSNQIECENTAQNALQAMQDGKEGAASTYKVELTWGDKNHLLTNVTKNGYVGYSSMRDMFAAAPRSAVNSLTLSQDGEYSFIVFEDGCTKTVSVNGKKLKQEDDVDKNYYIVAAGATVTVQEDGKPDNETTTQSGKLYHVRAN